MALRLACALASLLAACGGGGGSPAPPQPVGMASIDGVFDGSGEALEAQQWHLHANGVNVPPYGLNFEHTGRGIRVALLDTAIQIHHPDLWGLNLNDPNDGGRIATYANFLSGISDPSPDPASTTAWHGTAVAGLIASAARGPTYENGGGRGVAPLAELIAFRVVPDEGLEATNSLAQALDTALVDHGARVVNNSWTHQISTSFTDSDVGWREEVEATAALAKAPVIVFAAGNCGTLRHPDCPLDVSLSSWDTFTNSRHVIAVGASDDSGQAVAYSEPGANVLVSAPGGSSGAGLVTTDMVGAGGANPDGDYMGGDTGVSGFVGTSGSAAVTSGVAALMLQANAELGAREVAWILADTAQPMTCEAGACAGWLAPQSAAMGSGQYSHRFGFGRVDATAAVAKATDFVPFGPEKICTSGLLVPGFTPQFSLQIPQNDGAISRSYRFDASQCPSVVERVELFFKATPERTNDALIYSGDLHVRLTSPLGRVSELTRPHACGRACGDIRSGFTFSSVRHMGESPVGSWTIEVSDELALTRSLFDSWEVKIYGH